MQVAVIFRSQSDHERSVIDFEHEFNRRSGRHLTMYDVNTREGSSMATLYGVMSYPTVLALADDGQLQQQWTGSMPLINEVQYYTALQA